MVASKLIAWFLVFLTLSINVESAASQRSAVASHLGISGDDRLIEAGVLAPASLGGGPSSTTDRLGSDGSSRNLEPGSTRGTVSLPAAIHKPRPATVSAPEPGAGVFHDAFFLRSGALTSYGTALPPPLQK